MQATSLMAPYLPPRSSNSPFSEGGALYALGLIHANHGEPIIPFLLESLRNSSHEVPALSGTLACPPHCTCAQPACVLKQSAS